MLILFVHLGHVRDECNIVEKMKNNPHKKFHLQKVDFSYFNTAANLNYVTLFDLLYNNYTTLPSISDCTL